MTRSDKPAAPFVLVRCRSAGVHCGRMIRRSGQEVTLRHGRRIWRWKGANTLHEISLRGVAMDYTRISEPVPEILLLDAIEVIPCSEEARENLRQSRWGE